MALSIWMCAALIYGLFRLWYDGLRKPLTEEEIAEFSDILQRRVADGFESQDIEELRKFMQEDDGKEFIMVNLIQFQASPVTHPDTGKDVKALELVQEYFKPLMKTLFRRAGHPVLMTRACGPYMDAWNTPPNPGWNSVGLIRYRSRRDAMQVSFASSEFDGIHKYKLAALKQTFAIPTQINTSLYGSPRLIVALVLALSASIAQLMLG